MTGRTPSEADIAAARSSVLGSGIDYVVITDQQPQSAAVGRSASAITGCELRKVADVSICKIGPMAR